MSHNAPCPQCHEDDWRESDEDPGSLSDGGTYVKYTCKKCGYTTPWCMLPD